MPVPVSRAIQIQRRDLLAKVEAFAADYLADLEARKVERRRFWFYVDFFTPMVFDMIAWEKIHAIDLQAMPSVKRLFVDATGAAHFTISNYAERDRELDRGSGRRTFNEIGEAELAANILPRLNHILFCWGISDEDGKIVERQLTEAELEKLTRYYGAR